jgi:hypothetical protein
MAVSVYIFHFIEGVREPDYKQHDCMITYLHYIIK